LAKLLYVFTAASSGPTSRVSPAEPPTDSSSRLTPFYYLAGPVLVFLLAAGLNRRFQNLESQRRWETGAFRKMFCHQCGRVVVDASRFCNYCGAPTVRNSGRSGVTEDADTDSAHAGPQYREGRPETLDSNEEMVFRLRPTMIYVVAWYIGAALVLLATAAVMGMLSERVSGSTAFLVILGVALAAFAIPVYKHILRRREVYTLTSHKLEMRYGLIARTVRNIPLRNIQDVTVTASVWQRLMRLGDIEIDSAAETGKIVLDEIHHPERYADLIMGELRRRN
jgi:membrane protein YdbS with pleckstrin-like domain